MGVTMSLPGATARTTQEVAAELYAAYRLQLVRLAVLLVDDLQSAEDVVQDAFAAFVASSPRLRDEGAAVGYLRTTTPA